MGGAGRIVGLFIARQKKGPMEPRAFLDVDEDGARGDRRKGSGRPVVVVGAEGWRAASEALGAEVDPGQRRGQIVIEGVDLRGLTGGLLRMGDVVLRVAGECAPCGRMNQVWPGLREALRPDVRAGVVCDVVKAGRVLAGGEVHAEAPDVRVQPIRFDVGALPAGLAHAREALGALVVDHRREPGVEVVQRRVAEVLAVAGLERIGLQDRDPTVRGTAAFVHALLDGGGAAGAAGSRAVRLHVTERCNQGCTFCSEPADGVAEAGTVAEVVRRVGEQPGCEAMTGGEPTLHPALPKLIAAARAAGASRVVLETNATVLGAYPERAAALRRAGLDRAVVSLHASTAELSDALTQRRGSFGHTLCGIEALRDAGVAVAVRTVLARENESEGARVADLLAERFGPGVSFEPVPAARAGRAAQRPEMLLPPEQVRERVAEARAAARRAGVALAASRAGAGGPA